MSNNAILVLQFIVIFLLFVHISESMWIYKNTHRKLLGRRIMIRIYFWIMLNILTAWAGVDFSGLKFRSLGPALTSGRISDLAVDAQHPERYFVASASGGVWRTTNNGITFEPVFDQQGSYSIGCVTIDPHNPLTVWVGTGENNSQRSVSYGDGVYRSLDGGTTWQNMGLKHSEHIAKIVVDPRDSRVIWVAAQGPLWKDGGDRGLYKSEDGGETWREVLNVDKYTGCTDIILDAERPDVMYTATYQRRRHVWTLIDGGPGSAIYKSVDGGKSWRKLTRGLPTAEMGRIGLAQAPSDPNRIYAIVEARHGKQGFFRSDDKGESWRKQSPYISGSPQYYQEIVVHPENPDIIYSLDTFLMISRDGGKTWKKAPGYYKHVDHHALWIDPLNTRHMRTGTDGGLYETFDAGSHWRFFDWLPVTQFYRVTADNGFPFYNIYGGTQDNATLGGPVRTTSINGITNRDWFVTVFGDGFETVVDPQDPNTVYSQYQYGGLVRYNKANGEMVSIQPQPGRDEPPLRWNWNSALIISPYNPHRLYFGANILFRSDDRGQSWQKVSDDLTRQLDRNALKVMGKVWSVDAVAKNKSTSFYGTIVSLDESRLQEGLLYVGTDDGLIQVSRDGGRHWQKTERAGDVPEMSYVSDLQASLFEKNVVYASFDNHKRGDFRPYIMRSDDYGKSWRSISGSLPEKGTVYTIAQDHKEKDLLFAGTEYGLWFTRDGGAHWRQLKAGLPVIAVRDIDIQRREDDLILATFGRGFYVLDDYAPLRVAEKIFTEKDAYLFDVKESWMFIESAPLGLAKNAFQGDAWFRADNPPVGAVFTYYLKKNFKSLRQKRHEKEKLQKNNPYPSWDALRKERLEQKPVLIFTIRDSDGQVVRRLTAPARAGVHRVVWDMRYPPADPVDLKPFPADNMFAEAPRGYLAAPGTYSVTLEVREGDIYRVLDGPKTFKCKALPSTTISEKERTELIAFQKETAAFQRRVFGVNQSLDETANRLHHLQKGLMDTPAATRTLEKQRRELELELEQIKTALRGDAVVRSYSEPVPPGIIGRIQTVIYGHWAATSTVTQTHKENLRIAKEQFAAIEPRVKSLLEKINRLEQEAEKAGVPFTPYRIH
ncbi:MAG: glycosyl hydrolase [Calditrichaeota bacterium]|nr:MAG: glycosyl hydrolase [Calditrichota bacterium]